MSFAVLTEIASSLRSSHRPIHSSSLRATNRRPSRRRGAESVELTMNFAVLTERAVIERDARIPPGLADWLYQHFARLTVDQRKHLARLRDEYRKFPHADQRAEYGPTWEMDSRAIRSLRPFCQVCGRKSEHVHHRHYRTSQPDPVHVVAN